MEKARGKPATTKNSWPRRVGRAASQGPILWLAFVVCVLAGRYVGILRPPGLLVFYFWCMIPASCVAFAAFWLDKSFAQREQRRISERTLLITALATGWPGALLGQSVFRHKSQKLSFRVRMWAVVAGHAVVIFFLMFVWLF